jgi:hypothetical protein
MAPPPAATATATGRHAAAATASTAPSPSRRSGRGTEAPSTRRAPLRVVPTRTRRGIRGGRTGAGRGRLLIIVSVSMVVAALLVVVVGQAFLANGQVRMAALQQQLTQEQAAHRQAELAVAQLETPSRIVAAAGGQGMVHPPSVDELPYVSLSVPLPTPKVTPAPAPPPPTTSSAGAGAPAGTATGSTSGSTSTSASTTTPTTTP